MLFEYLYSLLKILLSILTWIISDVNYNCSYKACNSRDTANFNFYFHLIFVVKNAPKSPKTIKEESAILKEENSERKPIRTGPNKKPPIPTVVIAAKATPADIVLECPASEYIKGTMVESPNPVMPNPNITQIGFVETNAKNIPKNTIRQLINKVLRKPNLLTILSPKILPITIIIEKAVNPAVTKPFELFKTCL